jgi:hypothetical protein
MDGGGIVVWGGVGGELTEGVDDGVGGGLHRRQRRGQRHRPDRVGLPMTDGELLSHQSFNYSGVHNIAPAQAHPLCGVPAFNILPSFLSPIMSLHHHSDSGTIPSMVSVQHELKDNTVIIGRRSTTPLPPHAQLFPCSVRCIRRSCKEEGRCDR